MLNDGKLFGKFAFGINICKAKNININKKSESDVTTMDAPS